MIFNMILKNMVINYIILYKARNKYILILITKILI